MGRPSDQALETLPIVCAHCDAVFTPSALDYGAIVSRFSSEKEGASVLREKFAALERDEETNAFLLRSRRRGELENRRLAAACTELRKTMSLTEANAILGRGAMHVFSKKQAEA